jgi:DNA repair protein RecO (recombination protein O)
VATRQTEAIILRTYPLKEADKIVSFFSRDMGKARGVARGARKPKSSYGASLETMSHVRLQYFEKENAELLSIDSCELIQSHFESQQDYDRGVALAYFAEVTDQMLPDREPQDAFFRLLLVVLEDIRLGRESGRPIWPAITYFDLWVVRLGGFLPDLTTAREIGAESREVAREMLKLPLPGIAPREWGKKTAQDLRRFLSRQMEMHAERTFKTRPLLEHLD